MHTNYSVHVNYGGIVQFTGVFTDASTAESNARYWIGEGATRASIQPNHYFTNHPTIKGAPMIIDAHGVSRVTGATVLER